MDFKQAIKAHLDKMAQQDFAFAERYKNENKSLDECIKYITSEAKKQAKNGCAAVEDAVVYGWAVHYYQEDNVKVDKNVKAKVVAPKADKQKEVAKVAAIKPTKVTKKTESKCIQLDLFGGF